MKDIQKQLIKNGVFKKWNNLDKLDWKHYNGLKGYELYHDLYNEWLDKDPLTFKECQRIRKNRKNRVSRLKHYVSKMAHNPCIFLTLTFNNSVLEKTNEETRHKYVLRFLKSLNCRYVANIDYGDLNQREHYHAIVELPRVDMDLWSYGFCYAEHLKTDKNKDYSQVCYYIDKLTNHAFKDTCKAQRVIYSKL